MLLITIAIPTYNNQSTILAALDSCLRQSDLDNCEIILVDNASTDRTSELLSNCANQFVRYIRNEETVSMCENHNLCLDNAQGKYVLFCHSDDQLDKDAIKTLKNHLKARHYPEKYVCWGHSLFRDFSVSINAFGIVTGQLFAGENAALPFLRAGLTPSGTCYSKDVVDCGGFIPSTHRLAPFDSSTMVFFALEGYRFEMIQNILFFRRDASTANLSIRFEDYFKAYCDTYEQMLARLTLIQMQSLLKLISISLSLPCIGFMSKLDPRRALKTLLKMFLRKPSLLCSSPFWCVSRHVCFSLFIKKK
ncbi:glycosyltransferase [Synechococcus sp. AH-224-G16]|nr:glycosyltransferase [Synechococcus sp. AH-224-G16]